VVSFLLLACASDLPPPPTGSADPAAVQDDLPGAYVHQGDEPQPVLTMADIGDGIEHALDEMLVLDQRDLHDVYNDLRNTSQDADCPAYLDYDTSEYWYDTCTTADGAYFAGYSSTYRYQDYTDPDNNYYYDELAYLSADFVIESPGGESLEGTGYSHTYEGQYPDSENRFNYARAWGRFHWEGPGSDGTWLSSGRSFDFALSAYSYPTYPGVYVNHYGGVSGMDGPVNAYVADGFMLYSETLGSLCEIEPSGTISVRDEDGNWYDVEFHGPSYWGGWAFEPECDGCGDVWFRGTYLGQACSDFSALVDWHGRPW